MKATVRTIILLVAGWLLVAALPSAAQSPVASVRIAPLRSEVQAGEDLLIAVEIVDVENLYGFDVIVEFDPDVIELVDVDDEEDGLQVGFGTFLEPGLVIVNGADNTQGVARLMMTQLNPSPAKSGSGVLIGLLARGVSAESETPLTITKAELAGSRGEVIDTTIQDGILSVLADAPIEPTPTPFVLQDPGTPIAIVLTETPPVIATPRPIAATPTPAPTATATQTPVPTATPTETTILTVTVTESSEAATAEATATLMATPKATMTSVDAEVSAETEPAPTPTATFILQATATPIDESQATSADAVTTATPQPTTTSAEVAPPTTDDEAEPVATAEPVVQIQAERDEVDNQPTGEQPLTNQPVDTSAETSSPVDRVASVDESALAGAVVPTVIVADTSPLVAEQIGSNQAAQPAPLPQRDVTNDSNVGMLVGILGTGMLLVAGGILFAWRSWGKA